MPWALVSHHSLIVVLVDLCDRRRHVIELGQGLLDLLEFRPRYRIYALHRAGTGNGASLLPGYRLDCSFARVFALLLLVVVLIVVLRVTSNPNLRSPVFLSF